MQNENPGCLGFILQLLGILPKEKDLEALLYRVRNDFLSSAELSFYNVLKLSLSEEFYICPKVGLKDIFFVKDLNHNYSYINKIARKHVDFLLCNPNTMRPLAGVELDDSSHQRESRLERDKFVNQVFKTAQLPLIHFSTKKSYEPSEIREAIYKALKLSEDIVNTPEQNEGQVENTAVPICPKCGVPMVLRTASKGEKKGSTFYGCSNYPKCKETIK